MQAYEISKGVDVPSTFAGDLAAVRRTVRTIPRDMRDDVRVYLREFPHDKAAFVQLLNGRPLEGTLRRTWRPGLRGGKLIEIEPEENSMLDAAAAEP
jgi:hypothetical protein